VVVGGPLKHLTKGGLAFDYPADWQLSTPDFRMHYSQIMAFVGTGYGTAGCQSVGDNGQQCGADLHVGAGQVLIEVSDVFGPPRMAPIDPSDPTPLVAGERYVTVGGLPAVAGESTETYGAAELVRAWMLSKPGDIVGSYEVQAYFRGPGIDALEAQVEALVASIVYDPPVPMLNPSDAASVLGKALETLKAGDPSYACFPEQPGASVPATVRQMPGLSPLSQDLSVTCSSAIEPTNLGLWKATLRISWPKTAEYSAGQTGELVWIAPDGEPGTAGGMPGSSDTIPYWN
jgi:hypothetical protein